MYAVYLHSELLIEQLVSLIYLKWRTSESVSSYLWSAKLDNSITNWQPLGLFHGDGMIS